MYEFVKTKHEEKEMHLTKHQFKICEAVALGLTPYYMGPRDKREVTATERAEALATIPDLPAGWMTQKHEWDACRY
jgi:hypothetical protein